MSFLKLKLKPGLYRQGTDYGQARRYNDASFWRFSEGMSRPEPGWEIAFGTQVEGKARAVHAWLANDLGKWAAIATCSGGGTGARLYAVNPAGDVALINPGFIADDADAATWSLDNFGEDLVAVCDSEGVIYSYVPDDDTAVAVENAPSAKSLFTTDENFLVALGVDGDPRALAWCDQQAISVWTATSVNQAGDEPTAGKGALVAGCASIMGASLIWSTDGVFEFRFIGPPDVYGLTPKGVGCGLISRRGFQPADGAGYWMSEAAFFRYVGVVEAIPCDISDDVFSNLNRDHQHKVWCEHRPAFGELRWHYPRGASTECSHVAIYNYREGHWNHSPIVRLAGVSPGVFQWPLQVNLDGALLWHEKGWDYASAIFLSDDDDEVLTDDDDADLVDDDGDSDDVAERYLASGPLEIGDGERLMQIDEFIPDERNLGDADIYLHLRNLPGDPEVTFGPFPCTRRVSILRTARTVRVEARLTADAEDARIGDFRFNLKVRGRY